MTRPYYVVENDSLGNPLEPDFTLNYLDGKTENSMLLMSNFSCTQFRIRYFHTYSNKPVDLTKREGTRDIITWSRLYFLKDSVWIYPSGRVGDNSIMFDGAIGRKGVAWMLPEDYIPSMQ